MSGTVRARLLGVAVIVLAATAASADTGRIEINQAAVNAAGGFPHTITAPGSYVLTGDLIVTANVTAITIAADDVTLDLNGFRIVGPHSCTAASCPVTLGSGVDTPSLTPVQGALIFGGHIRGFGFDCVRPGANARVERMTISDCGLSGIKMGSGTAVQNSISFVGRHGIGTQPKTVVALNRVENVGLNAIGQRGIVSGVAIAGNYCDDGSCTRDARRRYYLSTSVFNGSQPLTACVSGFHMGSLWEILDPSELQYDPTRGASNTDSGFGPPTSLSGWIRTGFAAGGTQPGSSTCDVWTTTSNNVSGTIVRLDQFWASGPSGQIFPWRSFQLSCGSIERVWCVEDP